MEKEVSVRNRQRAECYKLLSACYSVPGQAFIEEGLVDNLGEALEAVCPQAVPFAKEMSRALADFDMTTELLVDYSALFIGPFELPAPPYGSVYLEASKTLMGDSTMDAVRMYQMGGVEMDRETQKDMPDHISVELEFMYYLLSQEVEAGENSDGENAAKYAGLRTNFMKRHLSAWVFRFVKDVREHAENPFYKNLADCTETFLQSELQGAEFAVPA